MKDLEFWILDVFAERPLEGNPLAVFPDAAGLDTDTMQRLAREMNYSESTFLTSREPRDGGYDARFFTPGEEVPFAGHPTLGTAWVIRRERIRRRVDRVVLNLKVGPVPVGFERGEGGADVLWMTQPAPRFAGCVARDEAARVLGIDSADLDPRSPVQEVSTGLPVLIAPVRTLEAVEGIELDRERYLELIAGLEAKAILAFCPAARGPRNDLHVRVFAPNLGVPEDPATGSANGCLAAYLAEHRCLGADGVDVRVEQGLALKRPSLLFLRARREREGLVIEVGGQVHPVARGRLL